ncbi:hypothetical protein ANOM_002540 [Aspergillus nomiae NRRL 13137]|uniref:WD-like domain-containing protein n=1 Tax=Aspergillus nomiae NRRL (strain ATCC 15546 / NRRL 13137 / CBS 260.88 / M93) TaxID=1509407 RepID=A0A0L1JCL0_ASPN3|nr:uncharacterized protein ANOM_002540 [Aspergillus nomiae NRRL 13137]KNG89188.1 hypothetical protein ANOM_002540 [Aspergillus nomiae NRRL 13137]
MQKAILVSLLGFAWIPSTLASPIVSTSPTSIIVTHRASDIFPEFEGDLSPFDVDVEYVGYEAETRSWLASLDPSSGNTDEEKAVLLTEAAYAQKFDANDPGMVEDVHDLLAALGGNSTAIEKSADPRYTLSSRHAINWPKCANILSCLSGTTCRFYLDIGKAPRSRCESRGKSNCCISWSTYHVQASFFPTTWTSCNSKVSTEHRSSASCQGHGGFAQGGDVCLSNRANGCT